MILHSPIPLQEHRERVAAREGAGAPETPLATGWVQKFVLFELACQIALLLPGIGPVRLVLRCAAFGASLAMLLMLGGRRKGHPA